MEIICFRFCFGIVQLILKIKLLVVFPFSRLPSAPVGPSALQTKLTFGVRSVLSTSSFPPTPASERLCNKERSEQMKNP